MNNLGASDESHRIPNAAAPTNSSKPTTTNAATTNTTPVAKPSGSPNANSTNTNHNDNNTTHTDTNSINKDTVNFRGTSRSNDNNELPSKHLPASNTSDNVSDNKHLHLKVSKELLRLRRNIGLIPAASYVTGGIIGVGIFVSPQLVLINTGMSVGLALSVWVFCAIVAFCGALCYAELGTRIRKSGGSYTYVREAWGDGAGFVFLWTQLVVVRPTAIALGALTAAEYALRPLFMTCPELTPPLAKILISICIVALLVFFNALSTKSAAIFQTWSTVCKLAALFIIVIVGIAFFAKEGTQNFQDVFDTKDVTVGGIVLAVYSCNYAYMGWDNLCMATEEVKNPRRNIPLATLLAVIVTTAAYLLALVSYHVVLNTSQIVSGLAMAALFTDMTFPPLMWVIVPCIAISATGNVNVNIFTSTRINFIGGRDGLFPEILSMVSVSRRTPVLSSLILGVLASVVVLMADGVQTILGAYSLFRASGETVAILGLWRLRRRFPATNNQDFYRAPTAVAILYLVIHLSLAAIAITRDTSRYVIPLLLVLAGIPIYFLSLTRMCRQGPLKKLNDFCVEKSRKLLLADFASKTY